jgi:hypothetical protein
MYLRLFESLYIKEVYYQYFLIMPFRAARNRSYRAMAIAWVVTTITASFYCLCAVFSIFKGVISLGVIAHFACTEVIRHVFNA